MTYLLLLGIEGMKGRGLCLRLLSPFLRTRAIFDSVSWDQNQTNHNSQYKQVILSKGGSEISKQKKVWGSNSAKVTISFHFASDWLQG